MTKMEEYENAWGLALTEKDFSLVDTLYHPMYRTPADPILGFDTTLEDDKTTFFDYITMVLIGARPKIYEDENQLYYEEYHKYKDSDVFMLVKYTFTYEGKKIIRRDVVFEELNYDLILNKSLASLKIANGSKINFLLDHWYL